MHQILDIFFSISSFPLLFAVFCRLPGRLGSR